jgi:hypothetical protein
MSFEVGQEIRFLVDRSFADGSIAYSGTVVEITSYSEGDLNFQIQFSGSHRNISVSALGTIFEFVTGDSELAQIGLALRQELDLYTTKVEFENLKNSQTIVPYTHSNLPATADNYTFAFDTTNQRLVYFNNYGWYNVGDDSVAKYTSYDIVVMSGQSNMGGNGNPGDLNGETGVSGEDLGRTQEQVIYLTVHDTASDMTTTLDHRGAQFVAGDKSTSASSNHGLDISFSDSYYHQSERPLVIIKYYIDGDNISSWDKSQSNAVLQNGTQNGWDGLTAAIDNATADLQSQNKNYSFRGFVWWQGESDPDNSNYATLFNTFRSNLEQYISTADLPTVIVQPQNMQDDLAILHGQIDIIAQDEHIKQVYTSDITDLTDGQVHWTSAGHVVIGNRVAILLYNLIEGNTGWTPSELGNYVGAWVDASDTDDASKVVQSNNFISEAKNLGSASVSLVQGDASKQPERLVNAQNGLDVIHFKRDSDKLTNSNVFIPSGSTAGDFYLFAVLAYHRFPTINDGGANGQLFAGNSFYAHAPLNNNTASIYFNTVLGGTQDTFVTHSAITDAEFNIMEFSRSASEATAGSTSLKRIFKNGSIEATKNATTEGANFLGGDLTWSNNTQHYLGELIIVTSNLSNDNRQKIEGYLAHKWGLTEKLDSSHPYKVNLPQ